jgi:acyl phosphate:glycerol-3-phosphate acyltransferase
MIPSAPAILVATAYLLGSIPFSFLVTKSFSGEDIRTRGSGNVGATNVMRTQGKLPGAVALVLDIAKGWIAVLAGRLLLESHFWPWAIDGSGGPQTSKAFWLGLVAFVAVLGHMFPLWLRFSGGKGVATAAGVVLGLNPACIVIVVVVFLAALFSFHYVSLGSLSGAAVMPLLMRFVFNEPFWIVVFSVAISLSVIAKHHENIARIARGEERRFPK